MQSLRAFFFLFLVMGFAGAAGANVSQTAYLKAETPAAGDRFGAGVAISGDTAVVGSPEAGISATGNATVFIRNPDGSWSLQATITGSNTEPGDRFGSSVAISGNTLVVGAEDEDSSGTGVDGDQTTDTLTNPGAAYIFVRDNDGNWSQQAYLKASAPDPEGFDDFGASVAIDGDRVVVGDPGKGSTFSPPRDAGAAFVFERTGTTWAAVATLTASNPQESAGFGNSVTISGDRIVVGARRESSNGSGINADQSSSGFTASGAAYEFVRDGAGNWSQATFFKASNADDGDEFGSAVSLKGDTLVVGAQRESSGIVGDEADNSLVGAGAAYVFVRDETDAWAQQAYLKTDNPGQADSLGVSVALEGDSLLLGAARESSAATGTNGDETNNSATSSGAAYLFERDADNNWSQQSYIKASNTDPQDRFGWSADLSAETMIVGALFEDSGASGVNGDDQDNSAENAGAAYIFTLGAATVDTFTIGGTVTGLSGSLTLQNNGSNDLLLSASGDFTFPTLLSDGSTYSVTVLSDPAGQTCSVTNGSGTVAGANVTNVAVSCVDDAAATFDIGGTISGLEGGNTVGVRVREAGEPGVQIAGQDNGPFNFADVLPDGTAYEVSLNLFTLPEDQTCTVENGTGTIDGADVDNVAITCASRVLSLDASSAAGSATVALVTSDGAGANCSLDAVSVVSPPLGGPADFALPFGVVDFSAVACLGDEITVDVTFDDDISGATWLKFIDGAWQELPGVTISGNTARFTIADNGPFDADPTEGVIRDPSGPGFPVGPGPDPDPDPAPDAPESEEAIPTLGIYPLVALTAILALFGGHRLRSRVVTR